MKLSISVGYKREKKQLSKTKAGDKREVKQMIIVKHTEDIFVTGKNFVRDLELILHFPEKKENMRF